MIEDYLKSNFSSEEYKKLNRHYKREGGVFVSTAIISAKKKVKNMTIILTPQKVITIRDDSFDELDEYIKSLKIDKPQELDHHSIFLKLIELSLDQIEDYFEEIDLKLDNLSNDLFHYEYDHSKKRKEIDKNFDKTMQDIGKNGDFIAKSYESVASINRALSFIVEKGVFKFHNLELDKIHCLLHDLSRLQDHASFTADKINFILSICLGMININQSAISKVISIVALLFLPPAIIVGYFGMNFQKMPTLSWDYGYLFSLILIFLSGAMSYLLCKYKRWI